MTDEAVGVVTFDLQNTFSLPKPNISSHCYKTKLRRYNLKAHLNRNNTVYNAIWHEFMNERAGICIISKRTDKNFDKLLKTISILQN